MSPKTPDEAQGRWIWHYTGRDRPVRSAMKQILQEVHMRSKSDVIRMVEKAKSFYKNSGKRIAFAEFTNPNGAFVEDEIYVFVLTGC